ncbi:MAG: (d)CMP kinase [bacterium]
MSKFVVAIDGGAGSGKSTAAKGVARRLKFFYLDTGAMYRAFTLKYLRATRERESINLELVRKLLGETAICLRQEATETKVCLDNEDVSMAIRATEVSGFVSQVSAVPDVRVYMVAKQREVAEGKNVVCEGRDIGTVVFPDAQVKIFMQADLRTRAERRLKELAEKNIAAEMDQVVENLEFRDEYDSQRVHSPLKKAADAIVVDTTNLTVEEEVELVSKLVLDRLERVQ